MKRILAAFCAAMLMILVYPGRDWYVVSAEVFEIEDGTLIAYHGTDTEVTVPAGVTAIGAGCFFLNADLERVILPDGLTVIGCTAFSGCTALRSVSIPDSVTEIGASAFGMCTSLETLRLPEELQTIGESAFSLCIALQAVSLPDSVREIGSKAFMGCGALSSIRLPDGLTDIADNVFSGCLALETLALPSSLETIGARAFSECRKLSSLTLPDSITEICSSAFSECTSLTALTLPDSITKIGSCAFSGCTSLTSLILPNRVTNVPDSLCAGCTALRTVALPDGITSIGSKAFSGCMVLEGFSLPAALTAVGADCFSGCDALRSECSIEKHAVIYDEKLLLGIEADAFTAEIPAGTALFADGALDDSSLMILTIPASVQHCGSQSPRYLTAISGASGSAAEQLAAELNISFYDESAVKAGSPTEIIYGVDTWSIQNAGYEFDGAHYLTNAAHDALLSVMTSSTEMLDAAWEGECFGLAATMLLLKAGVYTPEQIQPNAKTVSGITPDKAVQSFLNFYHFTQFSWEYLSAFVHDRYAGQVISRAVQSAKECNTGAAPFLMTLCIGHAVVGCGQEDGHWVFDGVPYDGRILVWDPNFPTAPNENAHIYYNSETLQCCIPYYHVQCSAMDGNIPITLLCRDLAVIEAHPYPFDTRAGDVNRDGMVTLRDAVLLAHVLSEDAEISVSAAGLNSADCNNDGRIQADDFRMVLEALAS